MENWKSIEGFNNYEVSNRGNVRRWHRWPNKNGIMTYTQLKPHKATNGYYQYRLSINGKQYPMLAHRLVANAFIKNKNNYPLVMHIDNVKTNNDVNNLKWGTTSTNTQSAWDSGLISKRTKKITRP
jgi:hypothetical protein